MISSIAHDPFATQPLVNSANRNRPDLNVGFQGVRLEMLYRP